MSSSVTYDLAQQMMTLSAVSYAYEDRPLDEIRTQITAQLANPNYATRGNWELVWGPRQKHETLMYGARDKSNPNRVALAIRGTDLLDLENWVQDLWLSLIDYKVADGSFEGAPRIAKGTHLGLEHLISITTELVPEAFADDEPHWSLLDFLTTHAASPGAEFIVTGHSMGGCLGVVLAVWLAEHLAERGHTSPVSAYTFAAPTPGNGDYARYVEARLGERHRRFYNQHDIVPLCWNNLEAMKTIPTKMGLLDEWAKLIIDGLIHYLKDKDHTHPANHDPIPKELDIKGGWFQQAGHEHDVNTYLGILNAPPVENLAPTKK